MARGAQQAALLAVAALALLATLASAGSSGAWRSGVLTWGPSPQNASQQQASGATPRQAMSAYLSDREASQIGSCFQVLGANGVLVAIQGYVRVVGTLPCGPESPLLKRWAPLLDFLTCRPWVFRIVSSDASTDTPAPQVDISFRKVDCWSDDEYELKPILLPVGMDLPSTVGGSAKTQSISVRPQNYSTAAASPASPPSPRQARRQLLQNPDLPQQRAPRASPAPTPSPSSSPAQQQPAAAPSTTASGPSPAQQQQQQNLQDPTAQWALNALQNGGATATSSVYDGGNLGAGWSDASYSVQPFTGYTPAGKDRGVALCKVIPQGGAMALAWSAPGGAALTSKPFLGKKTLEFWAFKGTAAVAPADVTVVSSVSGDSCNSASLYQLSPVDSTSSGWVKFNIPLSSLDSRGATPSGGVFLGCSQAGTAADVTRVEWRNPSTAYNALLCVDGVRLL